MFGGDNNYETDTGVIAASAAPALAAGGGVMIIMIMMLMILHILKHYTCKDLLMTVFFIKIVRIGINALTGLNKY